jgi:hypothetical protein
MHGGLRSSKSFNHVFELTVHYFAQLSPRGAAHVQPVNKRPLEKSAGSVELHQADLEPFDAQRFDQCVQLLGVARLSFDLGRQAAGRWVKTRWWTISMMLTLYR